LKWPKGQKNVMRLWKLYFPSCVDELEMPTGNVLKTLINRASRSYFGVTRFSNQSVEAICERIACLKKRKKITVTE